MTFSGPTNYEQQHYSYPYGRPRSDALKHAGLAAYTVSYPDITINDAILIGTAHEFKNFMTGAPAFESTMDLLNNEIGREQYDPSKDVADWYAFFEGFYTNGQLMIWWPKEFDPSKSDGILRWSNGVKISE